MFSHSFSVVQPIKNAEAWWKQNLNQSCCLDTKQFINISKQIFFYSIVPWLSRFKIPFHQYTAFLWTCSKCITKLGCHYSVFGLGEWHASEPPFWKSISLGFPKEYFPLRFIEFWYTGYWISLAIDMLSFQMNTLYMRHIQKSSTYCTHFLSRIKNFTVGTKTCVQWSKPSDI